LSGKRKKNSQATRSTSTSTLPASSQKGVPLDELPPGEREIVNILARGLAAKKHPGSQKQLSAVPDLATLKKAKSIDQKRAAKVLHIGDRQVRKLASAKKLTRTANGKIVTDDVLFEAEYRSRYTPGSGLSGL
jgi:hypothetical protein